MGGFSNYLEDAFLKWLFRNTDVPSQPANVFISLHSADPADTGGDELSGGAYARVTASCGTAGTGAGSDWDAPAVSGTTYVCSNNTELAFPVATADWFSGSDIGWFGIFDANTSGNFLGGAALTTAKPVLSGDQAKFPADSITLSLD
jgi:hypothetical protein